MAMTKNSIRFSDFPIFEATGKGFLHHFAFSTGIFCIVSDPNVERVARASKPAHFLACALVLLSLIARLATSQQARVYPWGPRRQR